MRTDRRTMVAGAIALGGGPALRAASAEADWHRLADDVKAETAWAFDLYQAHASGKDEIKPASGTSSRFRSKNSIVSAPA